MLRDVAWIGFGLIEILGRYGAVQGTVVLMAMRRGSVSAQWHTQPGHSSAFPAHAEPVGIEKKEGPTMGMEQLPTALKRRQLWGGLCCVLPELKARLCPFSSPSAVDNDTEPALWAVSENKSNQGKSSAWECNRKREARVSISLPLQCRFPLRRINRLSTNQFNGST